MDKESRKRQSNRLLNYLRTHDGIDRHTACTELAIYELSARICELEDMGFKFSKKKHPVTNRFGEKSSITFYQLKGEAV